MEAGLYGRRIAVVGTGATAVQIIETFTPVASQLTVFQRTPNTALPMSQRTYNPPKDTIYPKSQLQSLFQKRTSSFTGQDYNFLPRKTFDDSPEERAGVYEGFWKEGNLKMWLGTYMDMLTNPEANDYAYNFWRDKTRPRIRDARVRDLLVPVEKPYAFGCKRIPLETTYFECFNKPHVELIDLNTTPIVEATETGLAVKTDEGGERNLDFDIIIFATGFDSVTGGLVQMNFVGANGRTLGEYWKDGVNNTLGVAIPGFPNMFFTYGPQAPTALWQGPACAEGTGEWIKRLLLEAKHLAVDKMEATEESAKAWRRTTDEIAAKTLLPETYSVSWNLRQGEEGRQSLY